MGSKIEMSGKMFGKLVVLHDMGKVKHGQKVKWKCICDCGNTTITSGKYLRNGDTNSCGCNRLHPKYKYTPKKAGHRMSNEPEYRTWGAIKERCSNKNHSMYHLYGGRGISVCERWLNSFENFYNDMGKKPSKDHSIDRIDFNGGYSPENCKWSTAKEQANNKRNTIKYELIGMSKTITEWCEYSGFSRTTIYTRIHYCGLSFYEAIKIPMRVDLNKMKGSFKPTKWKNPNIELGYEKRLKFYKQIGIIDDSGNNSTIS